MRRTVAGERAGSSAAARHADERGELVELREDGERDDAADGDDLGDRLAASRTTALRAEDLLRARQRVEPLGVRLERLRRGLKPTCATLTTHAGDEADEARSARRPAPTCCRRRSRTAPMPCARRRSGWRRARGRAIIASLDPLRASPGPKPTARAAREQHDGAVEVRSTCATWPFLRASSRFLGVAFSVLSLPAAIAQPRPSARCRAAARRERCSSSASQPATNGSEAPISTRPTVDLGREADREDVELRHDARDDAERRVRDDEREQHRRGDLQRARRRCRRTPTWAPSTSEPMCGRVEQRHGS